MGTPDALLSDEAHIASLFAPLRMIPREGADFGIAAGKALEEFGCGPAVLDALRAEGLSRVDRRGQHRFAACDLHYLGVRLGVARRYFAGLSLWRRSLEEFARADETRVTIAYRAQLGTERDPIRARVYLSDGRVEEVSCTANETVGQLDATMRGSWPDVPDAVATILRDVATMDFSPLPEHARRDPALARTLGLIDCWTSAMLIAQECRDAGFDARTAEGFIVAIPFSTPHLWAEVLIDDVWTPVDPTMTSMLQQFGGLDPSSWPVERSLGPLLARVMVTSEPTALVEHAGKTVPTMFLTRRATAAGRSGGRP